MKMENSLSRKQNFGYFPCTIFYWTLESYEEIYILQCAPLNFLGTPQYKDLQVYVHHAEEGEHWRHSDVNKM